MNKPGFRAAALAAASLLATGAVVELRGQRAERAAAGANVTVNPALYGGLSYRSLGFSRGGRSTAVAGVRTQPLVYYQGSTGGGVWKTNDAGLSWSNVSDGYFGGGIGAITVADADPNVIYVGTGSACPRGNISPGIGLFKSMDAGKTWQFIGLPNAGQVARIQVHPRNPDLVYAAVLGNIFGESDERGVYRSKDGGRTWEKVLYVSTRTGASDISMDPSNPRILYAGMWHMYRTPWTIHSGSMDGGVYRSTDGGDTWTRLARGLPADVMVGKAAVSISPANPNRVYALIEAADDRGGVYRSDNGGDTWTRTNSQRMLQQRAWYYIHIHADPRDADTVWVGNVGFFKSTDGGRTFQQFSTPHADNHDLWINPDNPDIMINANDGGANVSMNRAVSWTGQMNQPTAEIYRVTVDNRHPYWVYGAQQDNSTAAVPGGPGGFGPNDFYAVGGGESGHIALDPDDPTTVYAGSYGGTITKFNAVNRTQQSIRAYPESQTGQRASDMKYRHQWNAPIRVSPHNRNVVYHASQYVHRSPDGGRTWEIISPDLTRNDTSKQDYSGKDGVSRDNTGVEVYNTIFALEESRTVPGLIWAGADDGRMHVTRDNGRTWTEITPAGMPEGTVNMIDLSAHDPGRALIAVHRYRVNDMQPYIYLTNDYGKTWKRLADGANGIPKDHFVRVVREDPGRRGLLYAGTERGMYVSFDEGAHWQPLQLNLPIVPVTDMVVHRNDLVVSTQGRAFWVLEDLPVLRQIKAGMHTTAAHLFDPEDGYRAGGMPVTIFYWLGQDAAQPVRLEITDAKGQLVAAYTGQAGAGEGAGAALAPAGRGGRGGRGGGGSTTVSTRQGLNRFTWDGRYPPIFQIPQGIVMWGGGGAGPRAVPGTYQVKMTSGSWSATQTFELKGDPRVETTQAEYEAQLRVARDVGLKVAELYAALAQIRDIRQQASDLGARMRRAGMGDDVAQAADALAKKLTLIEGELTQLQGEGGQDALNFPGRLDNQFVALYGAVSGGEAGVSKGAEERFEDLKPELAKHLSNLEETLTSEVAAFNELIEKKGVKPLITRIRR
jgi:photosystem II stability/assembly factor-like uncharacterized protein